MTGGADLLRRKAWLWAPPAVLLAVGLFFLVRQWGAGHSVGDALDRRIAAVGAEVAQARTEHDRLAALAAAEEQNVLDTKRLYEDHFSTESTRFTDLIREIKRLAEHAGLEPREIGYPEITLDGFDLSRRSFVFRVDGSYANLRMFLHLLELSPSFVSVNQIKVTERSGGKGLGASLQLSTFFVDEAPLPGGVS